MVIVYIQGGLGNQLFQYAAAQSLSQILNTPVELNTAWFNLKKGAERKFLLDQIFIGLNVMDPKRQALLQETPQSFFRKFQKRIAFGKLTYYSDANSSFSNDFYALQGNVFLEGNFQSFHYHKHIPASFFNAFSEYKSGEAFQKLAGMISNGTYVSVHIRRGDYVTDARTQSIHGAISTEAYIPVMQSLAMEFPGLGFLVFSDDKQYAVEQFSSIANVTVVDEKALSDVDELVLMSRCTHNIIANSSFSWWAAYLNKHASKRIYCPREWFRNSPKGFVYADLIPSNWLKLG